MLPFLDIVISLFEIFALLGLIIVFSTILGCFTYYFVAKSFREAHRKAMQPKRKVRQIRRAVAKPATQKA